MFDFVPTLNSLILHPLDNFGTVVGENPDCLLLSGTMVGENPDHVCWVHNYWPPKLLLQRPQMVS